MDARRSTWAGVEEARSCFFAACSADEGVETDRDEEELDDDDIIEVCDAVAPLVAVVVVVLLDTVGLSDKRSSVVCLLGDDTMTFEGDVVSVRLGSSFDWMTGGCVGNRSSRETEEKREPMRVVRLDLTRAERTFAFLVDCVVGRDR